MRRLTEPMVLDTTDTGYPRRSATKEEVEAWLKWEKESRLTFEQKIDNALRKAGVME